MFLPTEYIEPSQFEKRQTTCRRRDAYGRCISTYSYGRWIAMSVVLFVFFMFLFCCLSISARRRKRGTMPLYGTRWIIKPPPQYTQNNHAGPVHNSNPGMVHSPGAAAWPPTHNADHMQPDQANGQNPNWLPAYSPGNYQQGYAPPPGPPPAGSSNQEYFPPPSNPPPAHTSNKY